MLSKEEVKHIADLARLGLSQAEITKFRKELSLVLSYIDKLKEVEAIGVKPTTHPFKIENVFRKDAVGKNNQLISGFLKVKSILK